MKNLFKVLVVALLAVTMFGCSKPADDQQGGETAAEDVELVIWHTFTDAQNDALKKIAKDFSDAHEHINVVVEQQPYADFDSKVANAVRSQQGPDICILFDTNAATYGEEGLLIDFLPYLEKDNYLDTLKTRMSAGAWADGTAYDNKLYMWPTNVTANIVYYNKTWYDELNLTIPTTWDELVANSKAIADAKGVCGMGFDSLPDNCILWFNQKGITYLDAATKTAGYDTAEGVEVVRWFAENADNTKGANAFALAATGNYFSEDMGSMNVGGYIGSCAGDPYVASAVGDKYEWDMFALPQWDANNTVSTAFIRGILGFTKGEAHDQAVYEFAKYFSSAEVSAYWCEEFYCLSPYADVTENAGYQAYLDAHKSMKLAQESVPFGKVAPVLPGAPSARTELQTMLTQAATGMVTPEEAVKTAVANSNAALSGN